jgi:hypothetical protein
VLESAVAASGEGTAANASAVPSAGISTPNDIDGCGDDDAALSVYQMLVRAMFAVA